VAIQTSRQVNVVMRAINRQERWLTGLARGMRAAIVVPMLFALALLVIKEPVMAGFAVFGTFAHLVMVNYSAAAGARSAESAALTLLGTILVSLGTLASPKPWLAVAGAVTVGFLAEWPPLTSRFAVIRSALLMAFMLAVAVPTPLRSLPLQLYGWVLAGLMAQPALQLLWIPLSPLGPAAKVPSAAVDDSSPASVEDAVWEGVAMGLAVLIARLCGITHAFWVVLGVAPVLTMRNMPPACTFWRQQAGTFVGFLIGAFLMAGAGPHRQWYWIALPCTIFASVYLSSAVGFMSGQAGFTAFAVVLFCILTPLQRQVGILRIEDIAIGGAISLLVASLRLLQRRKLHLPSRSEVATQATPRRTG
jgi:hypothetical protein